MEARRRLTRAILRLILLAAVASAPIFLVAEGFEVAHVWLVLASNGVCAGLCLFLLWMLRRGQVELCARVLVVGLLVLVGALASSNGEDVHVNVVNFVLVTVLASVLLGSRALLWVAGACAALMVSIAWRQDLPVGAEEPFEMRMESIAQFLPTYLVVVAILWLRERAVVEHTSSQTDSSPTA